MKKGIFILLAVILCFSAYVFFTNKISKNKKSIDKEQPLKISKNSSLFNDATNRLLDSYFLLRDAFVNWEPDSSIQKLNDSLILRAQNIPFSELKADTLLVNTAKNFTSTMLSEAATLQKDTTLVKQKRAFYNISENLYNMLRTVQYDQTTIYHMVCPMAFNGDEEAYWLSKDTVINNPYLGTQHPQHKASMLHCGSISDSINYKQ